MGCTYLTHLRNDGVVIKKDEIFLKAIDKKTGKFTNKPFQFHTEFGKLWKEAAGHNGSNRDITQVCFFFGLF